MLLKEQKLRDVKLILKKGEHHWAELGQAQLKLGLDFTLTLVILIILCRKIVISLEPTLCLTSDQSVNSSLSIVVQ